MIFLENSSVMDVFGPRRGLVTELSEKVQYSHNQAIKNSLNEAILPIWTKGALFSR